MRKSFPAVSVLIILTAVLFAARTWAGEPELEFRLGGKVAAKVSLVELQDKIRAHRVRFFNVLMNKEKTYEAFALKDVLTFAYQTKWRSAHYSDIAFIASDGYEAVSSLGKLQEDGGFLAFRDLDRNTGWEPIGDKKVDPAPFFLIWTGKTQTPKAAYPWPWQVVALDLLRFEDQYPAVVPKGAPIDSSAYRGFELFRTHCLRCHAMDQNGGKLGPDLNAPQSIAAYRSKHMIKEFIKQPSKYRYSQMPDNPDLSDRNLEDLYQYFQFQMARKAKEP
jgi:mono/diheme cytochrome c family protein